MVNLLKNRVVKYIIYVFIFGIILYTGSIYYNHLYQKTEKFIFYQYRIFVSIFPIILGIIYASPKFMKKTNKQGKWQIDWIKLIIIGLPTLFFTTIPIQISLSYYFDIWLLPMFLTKYNLGIVSIISGFILGNLIIDNIDKVDQSNIEQ